MQPLLIGITGGTGSGKTTLAKNIITHFGAQRVSLIDTDSYYVDRSHLPLHERQHLNFDHPDAFDIPLLVEHLQCLKRGNPIRKQIYDFATHSRKKETVSVAPGEIVVVDGILVLAVDEVCRLLDLKIFIDEDADVRLLRRLTRDMRERGRTVESIAQQYFETVRPMHRAYVEPSRGKADIIFRKDDDLQIVIRSIQDLLDTRAGKYSKT
ncbi:MAG: uridine kinase [Proteobacteria bacterium]|nr:uridine kinase [Pseudomonadota bacterium]